MSIIALIEEAWDPILNCHLKSQPVWKDLKNSYGKYYANWTPAPRPLPNGEGLQRQAMRAKRISSPGSDGW